MKADHISGIIINKPIISVGSGTQGSAFMLYDFGNDFMEAGVGQIQSFIWQNALPSNVKLNEEERVRDWFDHLYNTVSWYINHSPPYLKSSGSTLDIYTGATVSGTRRYDLKPAGIQGRGDLKTFIIHDRGGSGIASAYRLVAQIFASPMSDPIDVAKKIRKLTKTWSSQIKTSATSSSSTSSNTSQSNAVAREWDDEELESIL